MKQIGNLLFLEYVYVSLVTLENKLEITYFFRGQIWLVDTGIPNSEKPALDR